MPPADSVLSIDKLSHSFGAVKLFDDLDLDISRGDCVAIVGASGVGKSTLLDLLFTQGSDQSDQSITFDAGRAVLVLQDGALLNHFNVIENLELVNVYNDKPKTRDQLFEILDALNIPSTYAARSVDALSGGEKRRVAIARALVRDPDVLCFDEPDSGLDMANRRALADVFVKLSRELNKTILFSTHDSLLASIAANRIYSLACGRLSSIAHWNRQTEDEEDLLARRLQLEQAMSDTPDLGQAQVQTVGAKKSEWPSIGKGFFDSLCFWRLPITSLKAAWRFYAKNLLVTLWMAGVSGLPFVFLVGAMLGATTIVVIHNVAELTVSGVLAYFMKPEFVLSQLDGLYIAYFAPPLGGILFAARSGSIVTAWLGVQSYTQQFKALKRLGINIGQFMRAPVSLGLILGYLMTVAVFALGMWVGSFLTAEHVYQLAGAMERLAITIEMIDVVNGYWKLALYGILTAVTICALGMARKNRIASVARHTTYSIILATVAISAAELVFAFYN